MFKKGYTMGEEHRKRIGKSNSKPLPHLRFEVSNCRTLCRPCHYKVTFGKAMPKNSRWGLVNVRFE